MEVRCIIYAVLNNDHDHKNSICKWSANTGKNQTDEIII